MRRLITLLLLTMTAVSFGTAGAAAISWSDPIPNAVPEVAGVVLEAVNCGGPAQADVGGIDFIANNGPAPVYSNINDVLPSYWEGPGVAATTGDANLDFVLDSQRYTGGTDPVTLTLTGLVPGVPYRIQLYFSDDRTGGIDLRAYHYEDELGNASPVWARGDLVSIIGSFVAGAETQDILIIPESGSVDPGMTAYVLSEVVGPAWAPYPASGNVDVPVEAVLDWNAGMIHDPADPNLLIVNPDITGHKVYLSNGDPEDPNLVLAATLDVGTTSYDPTGEFELQRDGTYWWRVDEVVTDSNDITGSVWRFQSVTSTPVLVPGYPQDALVDAGTDAVFTVSATNPFTGTADGLEFAWFKTDDLVTVLSSTDTLTVAAVQTTDEGSYFCTVTITSNGATADSREASLTIKQLIGYWPFDGDLTDIVGGNDGTKVGTGQARFDDGIVDAGEAVEFIAGADPITVPTIAHTNLAWTIGWWENSDPLLGGGWETMISCGAGTDGWEVFEFGRENATWYAFGFNIGGGYWWSPVTYPRGEWHYQVVSYDAATLIADWYIDGARVREFTGVSFAGFDVEFYVGNVRGLSQPYLGLIDDLKLYNYPVDAVAAAQQYVDVMGGTVCMEYPEFDLTGPEGEPDCKVDLLDVMLVIEGWLDHGFYPDRP